MTDTLTTDTLTIEPAHFVRGKIAVARDKSIAHRAVMFNGMAEGCAIVTGFHVGQDNWDTVKAMSALGVPIEEINSSTDAQLKITGVGQNGLLAPGAPIDLGNSGTGMRLLTGVLVGRPFDVELTGDHSLSGRPMTRIVTPLREMGAALSGIGEKNTPPLKISALPPEQSLNGIEWNSPHASAQVKSCILLAGLRAQGTTIVREPHLSRNHTELMLGAMGANLEIGDRTVTLTPGNPLKAQDIHIPCDLSAAAFFMGAGLICPDSEITLTDVCINPTRTGIIDAFLKMGARIQMKNPRRVCGEEVADLVISSGPLAGIEISGELVTRAIDELIILAAVATQAKGTTVIRDAGELRVKESDRIKATLAMLEAFGARVEELEDGMVIHGEQSLHGAEIESRGDHRIAMSAAVLGLIARGPTTINEASCIATSFPQFHNLLLEVSKHG